MLEALLSRLRVQKSTNKTKPFKKFNSMWLKDPLFKNWLTSDKNNIHLCKCIACNKTVFYL
jgi:hypothetical protein